MSSKSAKSAQGGVRYNDSQKQEIVDFVLKHNAAKGRGGVNQAVKHFKISPITIKAWLKASGAEVAPAKVKALKPATPAKTKAPKAPKAAAAKTKAPKAAAPAKAEAPKAAKPARAKKKAAKGKTGKRYTDEQKKAVVDFVVAFNEKNGRGGQNKAASKFKMSVLTVSSWLKAAGVKQAKAPKAGNAGEVAALKTALKASERKLASLQAALRKLLA